MMAQEWGTDIQTGGDGDVAVEAFVEERSFDEEMSERVVGVPDEEDTVSGIGRGYQGRA